MHALDMLRPGCGVVAVKIWVGAAVDRLLAVDDLPEFRRKLLVRRIAYISQPPALSLPNLRT